MVQARGPNTLARATVICDLTGAGQPLPKGLTHVAFGLNLEYSIRQCRMGAVNSKWFRNGEEGWRVQGRLSLRVGLAWSLYSGDDNTGVARAVLMESKAE